MNKNCTSLEQSKKLAEILPIESADMYYERVYFEGKQSDWFVKLGAPIKSDDIIPCWSLAALLNDLPTGKVLLHDRGNHGYKCICNNIDTYYFSNPVDACYKMLLMLHEQKLL